MRNPIDAGAGLLWLQRELARFAYRPGWKLEIEPSGGVLALQSPLVLTGRFRAQDSYHPERMIPIVFRRPVPDWFDDLPTWQRSEEFGRWLAAELMVVERHESREWLRRDGVVFDDPHAKGA